ncbi:MAG TPA: FAD-dependent oxidoreductase, partial [Actinomycetota bacterium]
MSPRRTFVIVGASLAGATAAAILREEGFDGRLVLIGAESLAPYERPGLSKGYLRGEASVSELFVRPPGWYEEQEIELRTG